MPTDELDAREPDYTVEQTGLGMAIALVIVLVLMIGAFIWFVIRFDPLTDDFIDNDQPVATATIGADEI